MQITEKILGTESMGYVGRGFEAVVRPALGRPMAQIDSEKLPLIVDNCPTGALTRKTDKVAVLSPKFERPKVRLNF